MSTTTAEWLLLAAVVAVELAALAVWTRQQRRERLRHVSPKTLERINEQYRGTRR